MREILGNLWDYYGREGFVILITTSGTLKGNGNGVMGKGCAKEARLKIPGIEKLLGFYLQSFGNRVAINDAGVGFFPTKNNWWEKSDMELIVKSADQLADLTKHPDFKGKTFILPKPGCGSGGLQWAQVKPLLEQCGLPDNVWIISKAPFK